MVSIDGEGRRTLAPPSAARSSALGQRMHALVQRPYPLCRSITGDGVRATLGVLAESILLTVHEIPPALGPGLDSAQGVEHPRRQCRDTTGRRVIYSQSPICAWFASLSVRGRAWRRSGSIRIRCPTSQISFPRRAK